MALRILFVAILSTIVGTSSAFAGCLVPDNGTGTADLPLDCPPDGYLGSLRLVDGLPPGDTIEMAARLTGLSGTSSPGGSLGGTVETFTGVVQLDVQGTGSLSGFQRTLSIPINGETHSAPRTPGDPVQPFDFDVYRLTGTLTDDFDFWLLQFEGGSVYGLPSPGETTLSRVGGPGSDFAVESAFDFNYRIQFEGSIESFFISDYRGITLDLSADYETCGTAVSVPEAAAARGPSLRVAPNPWMGVGTLRVESVDAFETEAFAVLDVNGRLVRTLASRRGIAAWDGADARGVAMPAGVYFVRSLGTADGGATVRFVKAR